MASKWKKINDITWKHTETGAMIQLVPNKAMRVDLNKFKKVPKRVWDVYVEARRTPKHRRVRVPEISTKILAMKLIKKWKVKHPRG